MVDLSEWWPWYERIANAFGYSKERDQEAADLLSRLLEGKSLTPEALANRIRGSSVIVFGAGPSIEEDLERSSGRLGGYLIVAADGTTSALLERGVHPHIIVTDLDGDMRDLLSAARRGSQLVVHAHGDNTDQLKARIPSFWFKTLGTTQVEPRPNVYNFGGFTDGDRCVFLAEALGAKVIVLAGMDFGTRTSRYSKVTYSEGEAPEIKVRKLRFGKELIEWLSARASCRIVNFTARGEPIEGVPKVEGL